MTKLGLVATLGRRMSTGLPSSFDPLLAAKRARRISGAVPVSMLQRVTEIALRNNTLVNAQFELSLSAQNLPLLVGAVQGNVVLRCERCLGEVDIPFESSVTLALVEEQQGADFIPDGYEKFEYIGTHISTLDLLEEEVLLALPMVPKHSRIEDCQPHVKDWMQTEEVVEVKRDNPFAVLKKQDNTG